MNLFLGVKFMLTRPSLGQLGSSLCFDIKLFSLLNLDITVKSF